MISNKPSFRNLGSNESRGKIVALVSGKGGSGKTMLAVSIAQGAAIAGESVTLVDTDFGTGGLTYYLTFREFNNARVGLSDLAEQFPHMPELSSYAQHGSPDSASNEWLASVRLVPIGDQRHLQDDFDTQMSQVIGAVLKNLSESSDLVVVDCRGGVDKQSLSVCEAVDEIVIVVETDATSVKASQHLTNILQDYGLKKKIVGFILNKVMDDPTTIAKTVSSLLRIDYLGSIPFDIEATRSYIQGKVPSQTALFSRHVFALIHRIMPDVSIFRDIRTLTPEEFSTVTLKSPEAQFGGMLMFGLSAYLSILCLIIIRYTPSPGISLFDILAVTLVLSNVILLLSLSDNFKQGLGRAFRTYNSNILRVFAFSVKKQPR